MVATCQRVNPALDQAAAGAESLQIAVATRQKSTARRLVSSCAVLEDTDQMVFTRGAAVTSRFANWWEIQDRTLSPRTLPTAASTSDLRGFPEARCAIEPSADSSSTVGVLRT